MKPRLAVVIPTYRRPQLLRRAVASVLAQELEDADLEVVIAVSDPADAATRAVAGELARDRRVMVVVAQGNGPAGARNAGMRAVDWDYIAFLDDDCVARPGWAAAGVHALQTYDLVQGSTLPLGEVPRWHHSIRVEALTGRWETCNIFARRTAVARGGLFDESLLRRTRVPWGEDTEWGWRLLRYGARPGFCADALALHNIFPRKLVPYLEYHARMRHFPLLLRSVPELRREYYLGHFWNRRHAVLTAAAASMSVGAVLMAQRRRRLARACTGAAATLTLAPLLDVRRVGPRKAFVGLLKDVFEFACLATGSVRWRRLLL